MRALRRFFKRLTAWATTRQDEERLRAEIEEHLALQTADNIRAGLSPADARREAVLKFGGVESIREAYREQRGFASMETLLQDTRQALRRLRMTPGFTITTVLILALGIGATTSIFSLVHAILLKSLPVTKPAELYRLGKEARCCYFGGYTQETEFSLVSYELYKHFRDNTKGFAELAAFSAGEAHFGVRRLGNSEAVRRYPGEYVSGNYFAMFGLTAYAGRTLTPDDDQPGSQPVAMMSYRLWENYFGADQAVIGGLFTLNDKPFTVVGITPPGFFGDTLRNEPPDFFLPLNTEQLLEGDLNKYDTHWLDLIGRIQPGAEPAAVEAAMKVELKQWLRSHWGEMNENERAKFPEQTLFLRPGSAGISSMRDEYGQWLGIVMLASGFVLMIVCANLANLMLVRGLERRAQISLSMALGARPSRIVRQAFTESIALALLGGTAGLAVAFVCTKLILRVAFPPVAGMPGIPISASPSIPVLGFAFGVSLITGVVFGIAPAWMATRVNPMEALRGAGRATERMGSRFRKSLVVLQAALSLVLLCASGLLTAALHRLENQPFGFDPERRMVVNIEPRLAGYKPDVLTPLYRRIGDSLSTIPGVTAVALCTYSPFGGNNWGAGVWVDGRVAPAANDDIFAFWDRVTAGYFDVIGSPILRGRGITEEDTAASRHVAVINEAFASKFFQKEDPIGRHFGQRGLGSERDYEIVGIVRDARYLDFQLDKPIGPFFFLPETQHDVSPTAKSIDANPGSHFLHDIVIVSKPGALVSDSELRQAMASVDPNLPVASIRPLKEQVALGFKQQRLIAGLTSSFGVLSLILASLGLFGVTTYNARRRVVEIGVRMALGADRSHIVRLILRGAFSLVLFGLLLGLPLTLAVGRLIDSQLYGMSPDSPLVTLAAVSALSLSGLVASLIPALRASAISPQQALRSE